MILIKGQDWTEGDWIKVEGPSDGYLFWEIELKKKDGSYYVWHITGNVIVCKKQNPENIFEIEYIFINE